MIPIARDFWTFVGLPLACQAGVGRRRAGRPFVSAVRRPRPGHEVRPYSLKITGRWYKSDRLPVCCFPACIFRRSLWKPLIHDNLREADILADPQLENHVPNQSSLPRIARMSRIPIREVPIYLYHNVRGSRISNNISRTASQTIGMFNRRWRRLTQMPNLSPPPMGLRLEPSVILGIGFIQIESVKSVVKKSGVGFVQPPRRNRRGYPPGLAPISG